MRMTSHVISSLKGSRAGFSLAEQQALAEELKLDSNWFDYSFKFEEQNSMAYVITGPSLEGKKSGDVVAAANYTFRVTKNTGAIWDVKPEELQYKLGGDGRNGAVFDNFRPNGYKTQ